jgi:hypothetical protein
VAFPVRLSRLRPEVTKENPWVSIATPVLCTCSSMYQLMKDDLPAEWFPISMMVIFFLGASSLRPRLSAMETSPCSGSVYSVWHSFRIRSFRVLVAVSETELVEPRDLIFPDILCNG